MEKKAYGYGYGNGASDMAMTALDIARLQQLSAAQGRNSNRALMSLGIQDPETARTRLGLTVLKKILGRTLKGAGIGAVSGAGLGLADYAANGRDSDLADAAVNTGAGAVLGVGVGGAIGLLSAAISGLKGAWKGAMNDIDIDNIKRVYGGDKNVGIADISNASRQLDKYVQNRMSAGDIKEPTQIVY